MAWEIGSGSLFIVTLVVSLMLSIFDVLRGVFNRTRNGYGKQLQQENQENTAKTFDVKLQTLHPFDVFPLVLNTL